MNGKQARALRKISEANTDNTASSKIANKIIKKGFKQFKRSDVVRRTK